MTQPFPKKYWWAVLIATPLLTAAIAILPKLWSESGGGGGHSITISGSDIGGNVQIVGTQHIFNEIQQVVSDPAELQELRKSVETAVNLVKDGFNERAIDAFEKIAQQHELASVYSNIGALKFEAGNQAGSLQAYETALSLDPNSQELINNLAMLYEKQGRTDEAKRLLGRIKNSEVTTQSLQRPGNDDKTVPAVLVESEDNGKKETANPLDINTTIEGSVSSESDLDVYQIIFPEKPRDYLKAQIRPGDETLAAAMEWHDENWQSLWYVYATTRGQSFSNNFTGSPGETYYLTVYRFMASETSTGDYRLSIESLHAYDDHEPNETILEATDIGVGSQIKASILDDDDKDFYSFVADKESVQFKLMNEAEKLRPNVELWDSDKASLDSFTAYNDGQNLSGDLELEKGKKYYLFVHGSGDGAYTMTLE